MPWLTGWSHRKAFKINLASGGPLTDYSVQISIDTTGLIAAGDMKADGSDIRFTQISGTSETLLTYGLWPGTINTTTTKIFIKIPSIPNGNSSVWMYYGNSSATAVSDLDAVLLDYDAFDDDVIGSKWTELSGNGTIIESGGALNFTYTGSQDNQWWSSGRNGKALKLNTLPSGDFHAEVYLSAQGGNLNKHAGIAAYQDDANVYLSGHYHVEWGTERFRVEKIVGGVGTGNIADANNITPPVIYAIRKIGSQFSFWRSFTNGATWIKLGSNYSDITFSNIVLFGKEWSTSGTITFSLKNFIVRKSASVEPTISLVTKNIKVHAGAVASLNDYWQDGPNPFFYENSTNIIYSVISLGTGATAYLDVVKSVDEGIIWSIILGLTAPPSLVALNHGYWTPSGNEWQLKNNKIYGVVANSGEQLTLCFYLIDLATETEERKTQIFNEGFNPGQFPREGVGFVITDDGKLWASYTWFGFLDNTYPANTILVVNSVDEGQTWGVPIQVNATGGRENTKLFKEGNSVILFHNWNVGSAQGIFKTVVGGSTTTLLSGAVGLADVIQYGTSYLYSYVSGGSWYTGIDSTSGIQIGAGEGPIMLALNPSGLPIAVTKTSATQLSTWSWNGSGWDNTAIYTTTSTDDNGAAIGAIRHAYLLYHQYDQTKQGEGKELFYTTVDASPEKLYALYEDSLWSFLEEVVPVTPSRPLFAPCGTDIIPLPVFWPFEWSVEGLVALDLKSQAAKRQKQFSGSLWDRSGPISFKSYQKYGQVFLQGAFATINTPISVTYPDNTQPVARPYGADIWRFYNDRKGSLKPFWCPEFFPRPHLQLNNSIADGAISINLASIVGLTTEDGAEGNVITLSPPERNYFDIVGISSIVGNTVNLIRSVSHAYDTSADIFITYKVIFDEPLRVKQMHRFVNLFDMRFRAVGACKR